MRDIPLDRLLVETDAPYLAPVPKRGKTNEPAFVAHTAAKVAELKGVGLAELEAATTDNFFRLFAKAERVTVRVTILGCGTSGGVPRPGGKDGKGEWGAANPADPRNRRRRCSILVEDRGKTVLVDTSPDLRAQLLDAEVERVDAVIWTHEHADQVHGIDDLRPYVLRQGPIEAWADERTHGILLQRFRYCFEAEGNGFYNPIYRHHQIDGPFVAAGLPVRAVRPGPRHRRRRWASGSGRWPMPTTS